jgi:hypothetical protein
VGWRLIELVGETVRNLSTRSLALAFTMAIGLGSLISIDAGVVTSIAESEQNLVDRGVHVYVIRGQGGIDGQQCHELSNLGSIVGSGALAFEEATLQPVNDPGARVSLIRLTPTAAGILDPHIPGGARTFVSGHLANSLGVSPGKLAVFNGLNPVTIDAVVRNEPRATFLEKAVLFSSVPTGAFDNCWVEVEPAASSIALSLLGAEFANTPEVEISALAVRPDGQPPLPLALAQRHTARLPLVVGSLLAAFISFSYWIVRGDLAVYRVLGTRMIDIGVMIFLELLIVAFSSTAAALTYALVFGSVWGDASDVRMIWVAGLVIAVSIATLLGGMVGIIIATPPRMDFRLKNP